MIDIYVLNKDLEEIGIIDTYTSLIWVNRYDEIGDCELYIEATNENLALLKKGNYLSRHDDDMVCRIEKVELDTDTENGNYIIATGYDTKKIIDQRIIWGQSNVDGNVENYIRSLVYNALVNPNLSARAITDTNGRHIFLLGDKANFSEVTSEQNSYKNIGEKIREFCKRYDWGYKTIVDSKNFYFLLYKGTDRSESVIFSPDYENLKTTTYIDDSSNIGNVALVAGEGEGSKRSKNVSGYEEGLNRYEIVVDARDVSRTITWGDLISMYPTIEKGGQGYIYKTAQEKATYKMNYINIPIIDDNQLTELKIAYPDGTETKISGVTYYQIYNVIIADLSSFTPETGDDVILRDLVYMVYLLSRGYEKLAEYGTVISFEGTVEPVSTFEYKKDYFLGDLVTVRNEYGIEAQARITEITEVYNDDGYSVEPKFEYTELRNGITGATLTTEDGKVLITENGNQLITEGA